MVSTRDLILETARDLFKERGYENVTINDICEACGITKSTFYYHIKSKQDIIVHYYDMIVSNITPILVDMINSSNSWEQIASLFDSLITDMESYGVALNAQVLSISLKENLETLDLRPDLKDIAISIITKGQETGQFKNPNKAESLYEAAAYMFTGYEVMWCVKDGDFDWRGHFFASLENMLDVDEALRKYS